jgi:hypothetical protein
LPPPSSLVPKPSSLVPKPSSLAMTLLRNQALKKKPK